MNTYTHNRIQTHINLCESFYTCMETISPSEGLEVTFTIYHDRVEVFYAYPTKAGASVNPLFWFFYYGAKNNTLRVYDNSLSHLRSLSESDLIGEVEQLIKKYEQSS